MKRSHDVDLDALMQSLRENPTSDNPRSGFDDDRNGDGTDHDD